MKVELDHHSTQHCYSAHVCDAFCRLYLLLMFVHPLRHYPPQWTHTMLCSVTCTHTTLPPPLTSESQLLIPLKVLCVCGDAVESCVVCNGCSRTRTVCTVSGREWCEVRRSNRSTVHCTRVWCGVWVVWCAAVLVAGG